MSDIVVVYNGDKLRTGDDRSLYDFLVEEAINEKRYYVCDCEVASLRQKWRAYHHQQQTMDC